MVERDELGEGGGQPPRPKNETEEESGKEYGAALGGPPSTMQRERAVPTKTGGASRTIGCAGTTGRRHYAAFVPVPVRKGQEKKRRDTL